MKSSDCKMSLVFVAILASECHLVACFQTIRTSPALLKNNLLPRYVCERSAQPSSSRRPLGAFRACMSSHPIVILPGFGNAQVDYVDPFGCGFDQSITSALEKRGHRVRVMPLQRIQWLNVLRGVFTLSFWLGKSSPYEPGYGWYVEMARKEIRDAYESANRSPVVVVGHSAGGWLGRAVLGDGTWTDEETKTSIADMISCNDKDIMDMTRGGHGLLPSLLDMTVTAALTWTHENLPGAFLAPKVSYITVGSDLIPGEKEATRGSLGRSAYESYRLVCGDGSVQGDGVVPQESSHLEGATQVNLKCYHSISSPRMPEYEIRSTWYGSDSLIDSWLSVVGDAVAEVSAVIEQRKA